MAHFFIGRPDAFSYPGDPTATVLAADHSEANAPWSELRHQAVSRWLAPTSTKTVAMTMEGAGTP